MIQHTKETVEQHEYIDGFESPLFDDRNGHQLGEALREKRSEAFSAYEMIPSPKVYHEEWRKTDPSLFPWSSLKALPQLAAGQVEAPKWKEHFDVVVAVNDSSYTIEHVTEAAREKGVTLASLEDAASTSPELVTKYLQGDAIPANRSKFASLNGAFWNVGFLIHIPDGVVLEKGILMQYTHRTTGSVLVPRVVVVAGKNAQAGIVECLDSDDGVSFASIAAKEFYVDQAAQLRFITLQEWGDATYQIEEGMAVVQRDAQIDWITLNLGSKVSKLNFGSDVAGEGAAAELDGIFFASDDQHIEQTTLQVHSSPNTYSRLLYKGAVKDEGHSIYRGIIQAKPGAIKVDAYQTNNNLVLSDGARADTIPGLIIDADDLKCSHGATIGNLDEEQLFYLQSRGIDREAARRICILGFFDEIAERIPHEFIRDRVHYFVEEKSKVNG